MALTQAEVLSVFSQVGAIKNSDQVLLITANQDGSVSATKITAELLRAYLNRGFALTIDEEGYLYIGGVKQTNKVAGLTPQITRDGDNVYVSLDNGATKTILFTLSELSAANIVAQTEATVRIRPNVLNIWNEAMETLTIEFQAGSPNVENEYKIQFRCPENSGTQLIMPSGLKWVDDDTLVPEAGMIYQVSVENGLAVYCGWEAATV